MENNQNVEQIEKIIDKNLTNLEHTTNKESNFDLALLYSSAATKYATFGLWEKAIGNEYRAFILYLKMDRDDQSETFKKLDPQVKNILIKLSPSHVASHLLFIAQRVRKENNKDYKYFLNELLKLAEADNNKKAIDFLKEKIDKGSIPPFDF